MLMPQCLGQGQRHHVFGNIVQVQLDLVFRVFPQQFTNFLAARDPRNEIVDLHQIALRQVEAGEIQKADLLILE